MGADLVDLVVLYEYHVRINALLICTMYSILVVGLEGEDVHGALLTTASDDSVRIVSTIGLHALGTVLNNVEQQC